MATHPENAAPGPLEGAFYFDPEDPIYRDHFPGNPVVPGSMIISAFMLAARRMGEGGSVRSVFDFRFKKFISPGEYPYRIEVLGDSLGCTLFSGKSVAATGRLGL